MTQSMELAKNFHDVLKDFNHEIQLAQDNLIGAENDIQAILSWLEEFEHSRHTYRTYQKESLRFLLWCYYHRQKPLNLLRKQDIHQYRQFLANPTPADIWCSKMNISLGSKKTWQPFKGPLSEKSIKVSMTILSGLFTYLHHAQYLNANAFKLVKRTHLHVQQSHEEQKIELTERLLSVQEFTLLIETIDKMKDTELKNSLWHARARFLFFFLAFTGLRISELEQAKWQDFQLLDNRLWLKVIGKGQKTARVAINSQCEQILKDFKNSLGQDLPSHSDPLICQLSKKGSWVFEKPLSARSINFMFKEIVQALLENYPQNVHLRRLTKLSPHWLRHFSASQQALSDIPIHVIKAHHRHSKEDTTRLYIHHEEHSIHSAQEKYDLLGQIDRIKSNKTNS